MKTITVMDPVTRIEGHMKVEIAIDTVAGRREVVEARCTGTLFRGFETLLLGRSPLDAPVITQRICGVCPISHGQTSVLALENVSNWLPPSNESDLEITIGYEQVAVDLTAFLARTEPDKYAKAILDFALLEDFDHLYRYANLMEMTEGKKADKIVGNLTEITPGRPTVAEHRHPFDELRKHYDAATASPLTKLHAMTIVAAEQQTMAATMMVATIPSSPVAPMASMMRAVKRSVATVTPDMGLLEEPMTPAR